VRTLVSLSLLPGLLVVGAATVVGRLVNLLVPAASPLVVGVLVGVGWRLAFGEAPAFAPGLRFAQTWLLRLGVLLLGLQLSVGSIVHIGPGVLVVVLVGVAACFGTTVWLGRRVGLGTERSVLLATGVSICGASAVAAANEVVDGTEEDVATAVASVTLLGTAAIGLVPLLGPLVGLTGVELGLWAGASVHEVGQVVAIGGAAGASVLAAAVVVKLTRVALLAPLVVGLGIWRRRTLGTADAVRRPPLLPWFVTGFLVLLAIRSTGVVPTPWVTTSNVASGLLLCAGMVGLGAAVNLRTIARTGTRSLAVATTATTVLATVTATGLALT
jgi:uncharacterized integral membrane protein (TIGR00698 family)